MVVRLLFNFGTPVPSGGQSTIDARLGIEEVIRAGTIERVAEEIRQNEFTTVLHAFEGVFNVSLQLAIFAQQFRQLFDDEHDWRQNSRHLRVFVYKQTLTRSERCDRPGE